jgi:hypothetical protein
MTIVQDNAKSSGIVRQRQLYTLQYSTALQPYQHSLPPSLKRDSRWSSCSSSESTYNTKMLNSPLLRNHPQRFVDWDLRATTQVDRCHNNGNGGTSVFPGLYFKREEGPGSPRLPTRGEFIEVEQEIQLKALEACSRNEEDDDDNDAHNIATHGRIVTTDLEGSPSKDEHAKANEENDQVKIAERNKSGDSCLKKPKHSRLSNGHYSSLKNSTIFPRIPASRSKSESPVASSRRIASQIDRILRDIDISTRPPSNEAPVLADTCLVAPVRSVSWTDEEEREEEKNVCYDGLVSHRRISGVQSW